MEEQGRMEGQRVAAAGREVWRSGSGAGGQNGPRTLCLAPGSAADPRDPLNNAESEVNSIRHRAPDLWPRDFNRASGRGRRSEGDTLWGERRISAM